MTIHKNPSGGACYTLRLKPLDPLDVFDLG